MLSHINQGPICSELERRLGEHLDVTGVKVRVGSTFLTVAYFSAHFDHAFRFELRKEFGQFLILGVEHDNYEARFVNTENGREYELGRVTPDAEGAWMLPPPPIMPTLSLAIEFSPIYTDDAV